MGSSQQPNAPEPEPVEGESTGPKTGQSESAGPEPVEDEPAEPHRFYAGTSYWNTPLPADAPLDPSSEALMGAFRAEIASEFENHLGPSINTTEWSVPLYRVSADQPLEKVTLNTPNAPALQDAFERVPIPPNAKPAAGTDATLVIWQPATDKVWEFWRASHEANGWHADWGGATRNVSEASGYYGPDSWPGAKPWWGDSSTSLGVIGGLITLEDLERGVINHALQIAIPNARAGVWAWPAQRTDGNSEDPLSLPEGAHLRLDPNLDLSKLQMPRLTRMIAKAAQRYGIFVNNRSHGISFYAEDPTRTGTEPYRGSTGNFEGMSPRELLSYFPWEHLQLLRMSFSGPRIG